MKILTGLFLLCLASVFSYSLGIEPSEFSSYEEFLCYEKAQVLSIPFEDSEKLSDAYLSLGETYLLHREYELALPELLDGLEIAQKSAGERNTLVLRSLFCLAIVYANLDKMDEFYLTADALKKSIDDCSCISCLRSESFERRSRSLLKANFSVQNAYLKSSESEDVPILGPDHISIKECLERVENTVSMAKKLIAFVKRKEVVFMLINLIDGLEESASRCCRAGGLWKACLQPLVNKWHLWNQKWKVFGIPPDPAWD